MRPAPQLLAVVLLAASCLPMRDRGPIPVVEAAKSVRVLEQPADVPIVWFEALVHAGSAQDPVGAEGIAALTAAAMVEAGAGDRSGQEIRDLLYPTGNDVDVIVDREYTSFRLRCHLDQAALCAELFTAIVAHPRFDDRDVARLRDDARYRVTDGLLASEEALGRELIEARLFEGHPYGHPLSGRDGTLALLDSAALRKFHSEHYVHATVLAGVAGGYTPELRAAFQAGLDALPTGLPPDDAMMAPPPVEGRDLTIATTGGAVTGFHFGVPWAIDRNSEDFPALYLAFTALGAHRQSFGRLFGTLRTARGLNYGDYAYPEPYVQRGWSSQPEQGTLRRDAYWHVWVRPTSDENAPFALKLAIDEVERFAATGLTAQELDDTRAYLLGWLPLLADDPGRRLAFALDAAATGTPDLLTALPAALPKLTLEEVNDAIARDVHTENLAIVAVSGDGDRLRSRLLEEAVTPIVYRDVVPDAAQAARDAEVAAKDLGLTPDTIRVIPADGVFK